MDNLLEQNKAKIIDGVRKITGFMGVDCQVDIREEVGTEARVITVAVYTTDDARFLIGKNGQNLKAFEHLVRLVAFKDNNRAESSSGLYGHKDVTPNIVVDVNDYKKSRATFVVSLAKQAISRVRNTQRAEVLDPMSAYERRIVHMELASCPDIATESIGDEPERRVIIKPYP